MDGAAADVEAAAEEVRLLQDRRPPPPRAKPTNQVEMVGIVKAIDPQTQRFTIAYEAADELGLPAGMMPFPVSKAEILQSVTVGEKVRFKVESHQIYTLVPF